MEGHTVKAALSKYLVIDTGGFIKNAPLQAYGQNLVTLREVVNEIRDKDTKQRLRSLPFPLEFMDPDPESIKVVTDFAKKSGDYASLSLTDIKVMALAYMLEVRNVGKDHLKDEPEVKRTVEFYKPGVDGQGVKNPVGFYEEPEEDEIKISNLILDETKEDVDEEIDEDDEGIENSEEEDDDEGWITPSNLKAKRLEMLGANDEEDEEDREIIVACLTTDFAMQNVMKQMGIHVLSAEGVIIKETKTWILRCYACFKTTPRMDLIFCPNCGNKTLKKVSVTLNADGTQQIHISTRKSLSARGKKFSLPKQQGGKYAINPILTADQPVPQQRKSQMAKMTTNAFSEDYMAGNGAFSKRDVTSKSAMLGFASHGNNKYWSRKNPNAVKHTTGNRKKQK